MDAAIKQVYGNRVRVRVCGLCWEDGKLLMVNHQRLANGDFWAPPGGGLEFAESVEACLQREFSEETGLEVVKGKFLFAAEFMEDALHAIELFFEVSRTGGTLRKGIDPELAIIADVQFMTPKALEKIPEENRHGIFRLATSAEHLMKLSGFFRI